nr:shikimate kinase [uncultured Gemmiger sp.]
MEYGLIGSKLGHSYSRQIHQKAGGYAYELRALPTEADARAFLQARAFKAINVTIPYKKLVMEYCDVIDPAAKAIGAVNTVVNRDGRLYGYNTDYAGFAWLARRHGIDFAGRTVLVLGTGGTCATVSAVCKDAGAKAVLPVSRRGGEGTLTYDQASQCKDAEIIVNTSPAGMFPNVGECLLDISALPNLKAVLDVVYNPFRTELLLRAEERGIPAYCGFEMLVAQAAYASELFTGTTMDKDAFIRTTSRDLKRDLSNVSLIGMPGCGKGTVGEGLAKVLNKTYVDLDEWIEQHAGMPIPDIFAREGEAAFRRYEADALAEVAKRGGQVIACGGGVVKTPGNTRLLRQNGPVLWVRRPVEFLATVGRPLSTGRDALRKMEAEREPAYRRAADAVVDNTSTLHNAVNAARAAFEKTFDYLH